MSNTTFWFCEILLMSGIMTDSRERDICSFKVFHDEKRNRSAALLGALYRKSWVLFHTNRVRAQQQVMLKDMVGMGVTGGFMRLTMWV